MIVLTTSTRAGIPFTSPGGTGNGRNRKRQGLDRLTGNDTCLVCEDVTHVNDNWISSHFDHQNSITIQTSA